MKNQALRHLFIYIFLSLLPALPARASIECYQCHGTSLPPDYRPVDASHRNITSGGFQGNHQTHLGAAGSSAACAKCHPGSDVYLSSHRDGQIKVSGRINGSPLVTSYNNTTSVFSQKALATPGSCNSVNCHFEKVTPTWGSDPASTTCTTCHGAPPAGYNAPYSGGAAGSHSHHDAYYPGTDNCIKCHTDHRVDAAPFAHATSIGNRDIVIRLRDPLNNIYGSFSAGTRDYLPSQVGIHTYGTCKSTYCHSTVQADGGGGPPIYGAPTWGIAPVSCNLGCHRVGFHNSVAADGSPSNTRINTGSHTRHLAYPSAGVGSCSSCHLWTPSYKSGCLGSCHPGPHDGGPQIPPETYTKHANGMIDISFNPGYASNATYNGIAAPMSKAPRTGYSSCSNTYCHSNGTSIATGSIPDNTSPQWGTGAMSCSGCHGSPPAYTNGSPKTNSHAAHSSYSCNKCHVTSTSDGTTITSTTTHANKTYNVDAGAGTSFSYTYNAAGGTCNTISCHGNTSAQWGGSVGCIDCHSGTIGNRAAITSQFSGNSHHIQGALTNAKCYQCHWEANSNGTINHAYHGAAVSGSAVDLVVYGAGRPASYSLTGTVTAVQYHYTTSVNRAGVQKITTHCLGCHSTANDAAQPFDDGKTPKQYAWDGNSVAARYGQTGTTTWGKYTSAAYPNVAKKKITKAFSAHGNASANKRYWDTTDGVDGDMNAKNTSGAVNVQCYDCHNSHGSTVVGITSRYSSATGRNRGAILKQTVRGYGGYPTAYKPKAGGSVATKDVRNPGASLCLDCHSSSTPEQAPLVTFKGYTTPWGYNATFNATQGILGYWDSPNMGNGKAGADQRYGFKTYNPVKGGHFGAYSSLKVQPSSANQINGLCTPCHDPHGISPTMGAKQQFAVPLLKGTWLTSPYKEDVSPLNNSDKFKNANGVGLSYHIDQNTFGSNIRDAVPDPAFNNISTSAGLCLSCHPKNKLTTVATPASPNTWKGKDRIHETVKGWKSSSVTVKHSYSCSKCHSAHTSSLLPRLMVTNCLDSKHKGRTSWNTTPFVGESHSANSGSGSGEGGGRIPGVYGGIGGDQYAECGSEDCFYDHSYEYNICGTSFSATCHEGWTGSGTDQRWNQVTPWAVAPP